VSRWNIRVRAQIGDRALSRRSLSPGYPRASFAQIAKRTRLSSTGSIAYHFASKDESICQVVTEIYAGTAEFMAQRLRSQPSASRMRVPVIGAGEVETAPVALSPRVSL